MLIRFYLLLVSTRKLRDDKNGPTSNDDVSTCPKRVHHQLPRAQTNDEGEEGRHETRRPKRAQTMQNVSFGQ